MTDDGPVFVRYMVVDVAEAAAFYVDHLGFALEMDAIPAFAEVSRGALHLLLSGPKTSAARPMSDGAQPGAGWLEPHPPPRGRPRRRGEPPSYRGRHAAERPGSRPRRETGAGGRSVGESRRALPAESISRLTLASSPMRLRLAAVPGVILVAVAAAMWGTDPIIRKTMSFSTSATTIVFGEHVILVALTLPLLLPALRAVFRAGWRYVLAAVVVGAGASAVATILFTDALIGHSDFITPVVIQKVQPFVAVGGAALLLGERPRARFAWFFIPALVGFWLVNQAHPLARRRKASS